MVRHYSDANCYRHAACIRFQQRHYLAFVMAAGFIADTASLPLIVPTWLTSFLQTSLGWVSLSMLGNGAGGYRSHYRHAGDAASFFRKDIPPTYDLALLKAPAKRLKIWQPSEPAG